MNKRLSQITLAGIMCALSLALVALIRFPIIPAAPYLIYEPGDIPILIASFALGPIFGIAMTFVVALLQAIIFNANDGWFGFIMHFLATGTFAIVASLIYKRMNNLKGAIIGLVCGVIAMTIIMSISNLILSPIFYGMPRQAVIALLPTAIIPFNLIKAGLNSVFIAIIYKSVINLIKKYNL